MSTEDILRAGLRRRALDVDGVLTPERIQADARRVRLSRRRRTVLGSAAAVVLAIAVPAALVGLDGDGPQPAPTPPTVTPATPPPTTPAPDPVTSGPLNDLPAGPPPRVNYLQGRTVHLASGPRVIPGDRQVQAVTVCDGGGLLVATEGSRLTCYADDGSELFAGEGPPRFATSENGDRRAYLLDGVLRVFGAEDWTLTVDDPAQTWPIGFLGDGSLVFQEGDRVMRADSSGATTRLDLAVARSVSGTVDLIAGEDAQGRTRVVDASGSERWRSAWHVWAFDPRGRYVAADSSLTGGDPAAVGILDATDGSVAAQAPLLSNGLASGYGLPLLEPDGSLLFVANDGDRNAAILRLTLDGRLARTTPVLPPQAGDMPAYTLGDF